MADDKTHVAAVASDAGSDAVQALVEQAQRLRLTWRILPASTIGDGSDVNNITVTIDGGVTNNRAQSLIGFIEDGVRVMVVIVPPSNIYIIGYYGSPPAGSGLIDRVDSTSNSGAIGAETVVLTSGIVTFHNGRAYRVVWSQRIDHSAAQVAAVRVRQTSIAGASLNYWQQQVLGVVSNSYYYEGIVKRIAGFDLRDNLVLTLAASAGTATSRGAADTVRYFEIWDAGQASDFPNAIAI